MNKKYLIPLIAATVLALGVLAGYVISEKEGGIFNKNSSGYAAVYLQTGEVYYGRLYSWPKTYMKDVWYIQNDEAGQPQLVAYSDSFWGPSERMYLNPDQVVWWTYLSADSEMLSALRQAAEQNKQI